MQREKGVFYGCLVGDALGSPVEFKERGTFPEVCDMIPCLHFRNPAGAFTDDGSLMLCLAAALIHTEGRYDPHAVLSHYLEWYRNGYMSATGHCFDIGHTTQLALMNFEENETLEADTRGKYRAGNGSLMRIAPIPLLFGHDFVKAWNIGIEESKTTHSNETATWCCAVWSVLVSMALDGKSKAELATYLSNLTYVPEDCIRFKTIDFLKKSRDEIQSSGYVVETMEAALWALFSTDTFEKGLIAAVNLGGDADTVGAVFGTLAGAVYGYEAIPSRWLDALQKKDMVENVWREFHSLCKKKKILVEDS